MKEIKADKELMEKKIGEAVTEFLNKYVDANPQFEIIWGWDGEKYKAVAKVKIEI